MDLLHVSFQGAALGKRADMQVLLPEAADEPHPVVYCLHGLSGDYSDLVREHDLAAVCRQYGWALVMPDSGRGYWCNNPCPGGSAYEDHVVQDVIGWVERNLPVRTDRDGRAITGISMGGYGAFMLALRHPELFCAASSQSGALYFANHRPHPDEERYPYTLMDALPAGRYDCFALVAAAVAARSELPALHLHCGREDGLFECNRMFHEHLDGLGVSHRWAEYSGAHTHDYWVAHFDETFEFFTDYLPVRQKEA